MTRQPANQGLGLWVHKSGSSWLFWNWTFFSHAMDNSLHIIIAWISATSILGRSVVLLGCSNLSLFTKSLSLVFILLLKLAIRVGLPLVKVLVCPVGPLIFLSLSSDHFLLSLISCAFVTLLSFARRTISPYAMDELTACGTAGLNSTDLKKTVDFNVLLLGLLCGRKEAPSFGHLSLNQRTWSTGLPGWS